MSVLANISAGVKVAEGLFNVGSKIWQNHKNQENMEENWRREDSAVRRRAADLEAAGLSKTLAAGSAAQSSAPIRMEAPELKLDPIQAKQQAELNRLNGLNLEQQYLKMQSDIARTDAQKRLIEAQEEKARQDIEFNQDFNPLKVEEKKLENRFASGSMDDRIAIVKANKSIKELQDENVEADTKLKKALAGRADAQTLLDGADKLLKAAQEARMNQLKNIEKEKWDRMQKEGGKLELEEEKLATDLAMKEIFLKRMQELEESKGYIPNILQKGKQAWDWFWGDE